MPASVSNRRSRASALALVALLACCSGPRTQDDARATSPFAPAPDPSAGPPTEAPVRRAPWTDQFLTPGVLVAEQIRIEGPVGLLEHLATPSNPELFDRTEKTVPAGYLQQISVKEGVGPAEIQAQLDNLVVVALDKLVVLERPGPVDVVVLAAGDASFTDTTTKAVQRADTLRFVGPIAR